MGTRIRRAAAVASLAVLITGIAMAADRPSAVAPYRFQPPGQRLDALEQQKAHSYRNQLSAERNLIQRDSHSAGNAADSLRRRGAVESEIGRIDRLLQEH